MGLKHGSPSQSEKTSSSELCRVDQVFLSMISPSITSPVVLSIGRAMGSWECGQDVKIGFPRLYSGCKISYPSHLHTGQEERLNFWTSGI